MKKIFYYCIILMSVVCCDDFEQTSRFFTTDNKSYTVGDSVFLTLHIVPKKKKEIRFFENFKNIRIYASLQINYQLENEKITQIGSGEGIQLIQKEKKYSEIIEYQISPKDPFEKTFIGVLKENKKNFIIEFKKIGVSIIVNKQKYRKSLSFEISGHLMPISPEFGASLEDYIEPVSIKLNSEN